LTSLVREGAHLFRDARALNPRSTVSQRSVKDVIDSQEEKHGFASVNPA
jgi:hypothetical protein